jgi:hypothetical protein
MAQKDESLAQLGLSSAPLVGSMAVLDNIVTMDESSYTTTSLRWSGRPNRGGRKSQPGPLKAKSSRFEDDDPKGVIYTN